MAFERHAFFRKLAQVCKRHDLKAPRVCENRAVPIHEFMQTAQSGDAFGGGAQHKVIGVAKEDVGTCGAHAFGHHRFDCCGSPDWHKCWRADIAPRCADCSSAGFARSGGEGEGEFLCHSFVSWRK